ncbi:MAG: DUF3859 domain-containing protein, partial [Pseudomonas qingdaonensis]
MSKSRLGAMAALMLVSAVAGAEVRVQGPVEYGVFQTRHQD